MEFQLELLYRVEVLIPTAKNDGTPVEPEKIENVRFELVERFGGCKLMPTPYNGFWTEPQEQVTYQDKVLQFVTDCERSDINLKWFEAKKSEWEREFEQIEIYITFHELTRIV